jgi:hypothetical protein
MAKKKVVFLFGSGATISWKSPTTRELTQIIRNSGFKTRNNETTITEYIFQALIRNGYAEDDVNFETIISVIEEFIIFYANHDGDKKTTSILSCFFNPQFEEEVLNFSIKGGEKRHGYQLQIPAGKEYNYASYSYNNETPAQFFFQHLIAVLLTEINARISEYAYHTQGNSSIDLDLTVSKSFIKWMIDLSSTKTLRLNTLNYERIFKILLSRNNLEVFEGFNCGEYVDNFGALRADVCRILSDADGHVHYNLHGSAFWRVFELDKDQLPNPEIGLMAYPVLPINDSPSSIQVEKGKTVMVTNIITGYQKAQKGMITPFKQMQAAFDKDCCFADQVYIVGYSFGDEHINESIKTSLRHNSNIKFTIIDPHFIKNEMDYQFALKIFPYKSSGDLRPQKEKDNLYRYFDNIFTIHTITFEEFLTNIHSVNF